MQALCSGHLDPEDLALVSGFMSGHISSDAVFPPCGAVHPSLCPQPTQDHDSEDEDDERGLDENSVLKYATEEVNVLKRVLELKRAGLWSADDSSCGTTESGTIDNSASISSLAPPTEPTCRTFSDYMFAEVNWLAEDFKRERQWKRVSAKKLALTALKCYREKTERASRIEKEEVIRVRKMCAFIARMVRDWWRQMDKIVQAKQQVRLTAKRQQAISSHLGQVLETTEEYTRWLTEGITNSKSTQNSNTINSISDSQKENVPVTKENDPKPNSQQPDFSDEEFVADEKAFEEAEDDEETIEQEEKIAMEGRHISGMSPTVELAQLEAEADCPLEDLLPPGYLEFLESCSANKECLSDNELKDSKEAAEEESEGTNNKCELSEENREIKNEVNTCVSETSLPVEETGDITPHHKNELDDEEYSSTSDVESNSQSSVSSESNENTDDETEQENSDAEESSSLKSDSEVSLRELVDHEANDKVEETVNDVNVNVTGSNSSETQQSSCQTLPGGENIESITKEAVNASSEAGLTTISSPFLLSGGTLREYQTVGLSWLVAIYDKRLNGILADEMGLGKTIQTISLLAYLACERGVWGPHLIVVPTSVILNWEVEFKRWCPAFKILTYYGSIKERKLKRTGWTKTNAFHICITSYSLAIQDAGVFKRKKWKYLILDEAQNIKNFKSQRWQTLLTFNSQRRLLLTGTPLQNSLMELWSLMHFLMPNIFQSHRDFQEWFASPITGMIEGNTDHNDLLVQRLHKVLRPFLLRRLKADVERQLPKKYEHVIMCRLSRRQRFLYDDFMSLGSTQETLKSGQFLSVMNILMQLRKVCNHPNLFETRPIISPFRVADSYVTYSLPRLLVSISHPFLVFAPSSNGGQSVIGSASAFTEPDLDWLDVAGSVARLLGQTMNLVEMARDLPGFVANRCHQLCAKKELITVIDSNDVVDDVISLRVKFNSLKKSHKSLDEYTNKSPLFDLNCMDLDRDDEHYPGHSSAVTRAPNMIQADFPKNSWDIGMPKSCLRHRYVERQNRLLLMNRINERRCNTIFTSQSNDIGNYWDHGTHIGPDVVFHITRLLREKPLEYSNKRSRTYPGLISGTTNCYESLYTWPSQNCSFVSDDISRVDEASCFEITSRLIVPISSKSTNSEGALMSYVSKPLRKMLHSPYDYLNDLHEILKRFVFVVPAVISSGFMLQVSSHALEHQVVNQESRIRDMLLNSGCLPSSCFPVNSFDYQKSANRLPPLSPQIWLMPSKLHQLVMSCRIQFPDPRLIQYDCGKLQRLNGMLRELKSGNHRVLIFTQMARMLDILEQFLAYHGHRYLRLDGTTKVEQRQVLMERFNQDPQIFVFILSTRSGGLGINLTGADTVIFYDSDWNPTMDAQAQDRCHRIGQTRDVHIYRLISERTVEENILRKANQKRFLSDVAIEGGKFTTAFFKQNTITELFAEPSGLQDLEKVKDSVTTETSASMVVDSEVSSQSDPGVTTTRSGRQVRPPSSVSTLSQDVSITNDSIEPALNTEAQLEALLDACEEESDRIAARRALDEAKADLAEFDEKLPCANSDADPENSGPGDSSSIPLGDEIDPLSRLRINRQRLEEGQSNSNTAETIEEIVERELVGFESQLKPVERFGVRQVEEQREQMLNEELDMADAERMESERLWRLEKLKALHEADEERAELEEDDMFYCSGKYDPSSQLAELERLERIRMEEASEVDTSLGILDSGQIFASGRSKYSGKRTYDSSKALHKVTKSHTNSSINSESRKLSKISNMHKRPRFEEKKQSTNVKMVHENQDESDTSNHFVKGNKPKIHLSHDDMTTKSKTGMDEFVERMHFPPVVVNKRLQSSDVLQDANHNAKSDMWNKASVSSHDVGKEYQPYHAHQPAGEREQYSGSEQTMTDDVWYPSRQAVGCTMSHKRRDSFSVDFGVPNKAFCLDTRNSDISDNHCNPENVVHEEIVETDSFNELLIPKTSCTTGDGSATTTITTTTTNPFVHNKYQTPPEIPFRLLNPTSPSPRPPPEPIIRIRTFPEGNRLNFTAKQLLVPTGQPVFVITRHMTMPSGEVYQQQFTHPLVPPSQFERMVSQLHKPSGSIPQTPKLYEACQIRPRLTVQSTIISRSSLLNDSIPVHPTETVQIKTATKIPSTLNVSPNVGLQNTVYAKQFTQFSRSPANGIRCGTSIPVIRMINCSTNKTTPLIRLTTPENNFVNNDIVHSPSTQPSIHTSPNAIRIGDAVRLIPNHVPSAKAPIVKLQRVASNLTYPKTTISH
ncbi:unnamed protein product [Trichobilharzia szidati]|nr:unnamed protein product [Trichobilharzia szidati]